MTLRRIHQNITSIKNHTPKLHIDIPSNHESVIYDEEEPPHPKMLIESPPKWANSKIKADISNLELKTSTAREKRRSDLMRNTAGNFTALNSSRRSKFQTIGPSNTNSPKHQEELFVPQRKPIIEQSKLASIKAQKLKNNSFTTIHKKPLSPENNEDLSESKLRQFSKIKLIQPNKTIHHISHLRKYENQQKQRETLLNNRLKFITVDNQKETKKLQFVKRKFQKVVSIRSTSLKEKQLLNRTKSIIDSEQRNYKFSKVNSVKEQENQRRLSMSRLSHGKSIQASILRDEQKNIEREILSSRLTELQKKKEAVRHAQSSLERSRQRISEINRSRISSIRSIENKNLMRNYMNVQKREKVNQKLTQTLQREIKLINERKLKAASELRQYEEFLGLNKKKSKEMSLISKERQNNSIDLGNRTFQGKARLERAVSSTFSSSGSKSFYLTNC